MFYGFNSVYILKRSYGFFKPSPERWTCWHLVCFIIFSGEQRAPGRSVGSGEGPKPSPTPTGATSSVCHAPSGWATALSDGNREGRANECSHICCFTASSRRELIISLHIETITLERSLTKTVRVNKTACLAKKAHLAITGTMHSGMWTWRGYV